MTIHRTATAHTAWCAQGHHCNLGEHRSLPMRWQTPYGAVVATLVQRADTGTAFLDLHLNVVLGDEYTARQQATAIAAGVDHTIRTITNPRPVGEVTL